jgi:hypothetical protein
VGTELILLSVCALDEFLEAARVKNVRLECFWQVLVDWAVHPVSPFCLPCLGLALLMIWHGPRLHDLPSLAAAPGEAAVPL